MPIRESLQTNAPTLGELLANGRRYRVPPFQRNYSWGRTEWEDLWADVVAVEDAGRDHYLGAIVLQRVSDEEDLFDVIDGQQRLTSLTIVILACIGRLESLVEAGSDPEENRQRAALLRERLISPRAATSLMRQSRLQLNKADDPFFQSALINDEPPANKQRLSHSEKALWSAGEYFRSQVEDHFDDLTEGAALARFVENTLARRLVFIEIVVDDEAAAYTVFETLNARGVALGTADLLKNYVFAQAAGGSPADAEEMQRKWDRLVQTVPLDQVADLAHHHANTQELNVAKRHVFRRVRESITSKVEAFEYVRELGSAAEWYAALLDPNDEMWTGLAKVREWIRVLVILRAEQYRPLALAAAPRFHDKPKDLEALFRIIAIYTIRANIVLRINSGDIYRAWNRAAVDVTRGKAKSPSDIARSARAIYGDDEAFRAAFRELSIPARGSRKKLLRYLLAELERDASGRPVDWETAPFTIEHVMPEAESEAWPIDEDDRDRFASRIGNYVTLEAPKNRDAAQLGYADKLAVYATSVYTLPKQLGGEEWVTESVRHRSDRYASRAQHIWRVDL